MALQPEKARVAVQLLEPTEVPVERWRASVVASYRPLEPGAPGTQVTTKSRGNCQPNTGVVFIPLPSFERCKRSFDRTVEVRLPARQISLVGERSLNLDFDPLIEDGGARYLISDLYLELQPCEAECETIQLKVDLSCYAEERENEIIADRLQITYGNGSGIDPAAAECGLKRGDWPGWTSRAFIQSRIRGHFGEDVGFVSSDLLDSFTAIPTQANGWLWNPTARMGTFQDFCTLAPGENTYKNTVFKAQLSAEQGWSYAPDVEVMVYSTPAGKICAIWLDGTQPHEGYESRVRYFYEFADGHLVQVRTDEPENLERTWRFVGDQPMEYIHKQDPDSVAGQENILYWHRLAAQEWPALMDYAPDLDEFAAQQAFAQHLLALFKAEKNRH
ncbi:MAG TPA: hypothetical protein VJA19_19010 [Pseudomonas sp.]|nr:hypothetical protein [Pseudomonas sp.]